MKRFFVLLAAMIYLGINVYASDTCIILDISGKATTDTINVSVVSFDNTAGTVSVSFSSDSDRPVNAYLAITVDGTSKLAQSIRVDPFQSNTKEFKVGAWQVAKGKTSVVTADISGAKCLK
jgi:hypothetical protein